MRLTPVYALALLAVLTAPVFAQDVTVTTSPDTVIQSPASDVTATASPAAEEDTRIAPISPEVQAIMNTPQPPAETGETASPEALPAIPESQENKEPEYDDTQQVELRILDKVRAESRTYVLNVGRTVAYANIRIRPRACRKSSPLDDPENASFLQIWEVKPDQTSAWIFSGWMFASSPSLSGMDHPVYDVTVLDCKSPDSGVKSDSTATTAEPAPAQAPDSDAQTNAETESEGEGEAESEAESAPASKP